MAAPCSIEVLLKKVELTLWSTDSTVMITIIATGDGWAIITAISISLP